MSSSPPACLLLLLLACRDDEPFERLARPVDEIAVQPPPPPPPSPLDPEPSGPPPELEPVLAPQAEPAVVKVFELTEGAARSTLLGYGIKRAKQLDVGLAAQLVERLGRSDAYVDGGDYECLDEPLGLNLSRGTAVREVVVDCGYVYFTPSRHDGRFVLLAPEVNRFIYSLR